MSERNETEKFMLWLSIAIMGFIAIALLTIMFHERRLVRDCMYEGNAEWECYGVIHGH